MGCMNTKRESAPKVGFRKKIPCCTQELNLSAAWRSDALPTELQPIPVLWWFGQSGLIRHVTINKVLFWIDYVLVTLTWRSPFVLRREEAPVCVAHIAIVTVQQIVTECADLGETRKKYFKERSLLSFRWNVNLEVIVDFLREIGVFYKTWSVVK